MKTKFMHVLVFSVVLVLVLPFVAAVETPIVVETLPSHQVALNILNPNNGDAYKSLEGNSNTAGTVTLTYTSTSSQKIDIYAIIRNGVGKIVLTKKFEGLETGSAISIKVLSATAPAATTTPNVSANETPKNLTPLAPLNVTPNLTATNVTNLTTTNSTASGEFGASLSSVWSAVSGYFYWVVIAVIVILVILVFIKYWSLIREKIRKWRTSSTASNKERVSEKDFDKSSPRGLLNAERKLRQLQEEIDTIKNKSRRVAEAERKFEEAKRELERLRRE